jgi:hypothetical protein
MSDMLYTWREHCEQSRTLSVPCIEVQGTWHGAAMIKLSSNEAVSFVCIRKHPFRPDMTTLETNAEPGQGDFPDIVLRLSPSAFDAGGYSECIYNACDLSFQAGISSA